LNYDAALLGRAIELHFASLVLFVCGRFFFARNSSVNIWCW